ncbi:FAD-binding oxidoreductase [Pseudomonas aeruginosa]|uniref:FAD-binding oxidoreductase n=1 Tax=Pseudomonas aeruginosa TaxID=287 RepID=UPI0018C65C11|nr:FAD-binding protein [Pseudomonas aeruginosa]
MDDSELYRSLCEILGARGVRDSAALAGQDPGYHPQNLAGSFLVLPESTDQVAAVVRLCRQAGRALVPQGGLTGLVGGGAAQAGDVLLSLRRLNRIHRLDAASQTLDLDAGVTLEQAQALAAEAGLDPGIDLAARGSAWSRPTPAASAPSASAPCASACSAWKRYSPTAASTATCAGC